MKVRCEKAGNRILLAADRPLNGLSSAIPGAYFRKDKTWSLPLDLETCKILREQYTTRLEIGPMLWSWAKGAKEARTGLQETASASDADLFRLPEVAPVLAAAMASRTYQRVAARYIADAQGRDGRRRALVADTVGLGKTAEALAGILENGESGPYLIVCPKTAVNSTWKREINRWLPEDEVITLPEGKAAREKVLNSLLMQNRAQAARGFAPGLELTRQWVIVHPYAIRTQTWWICALCGSQTKYTTRPTSELDCGHAKDRLSKVSHDSVFPQLFGMSWGAMVVDESDQILIKLTGTPNLQRRGAELLGDLVRPNGVRLAMSGTPHRSKPHQIWSTLNWLDSVRWSGKWRWVGRYWETTNGTFGGTTIGDFREEREHMLEDELSDVMLRRTRDEVRGDLPAKLYADNTVPGDELPKGIWLTMTTKQAKAYKQMELMGEADVEGGTVTTIGVLAEMTRLKQFAGAVGSLIGGEFTPLAEGDKYEWLLEFLQGIGLPDKPSTKVVVASQFTKILNAFREGIIRDLKLRVGRTGMVTGEVTGAKRDANIDRFEDLNDQMDILFINTKAGGSSITLDAAEVMIILDETWVDDEQEQLEGRIDNRQPERRIVPRTYYYLRSLSTVEESIAVSNAEAKKAGKRILDGVTPKQLRTKLLQGSSK